MGKAKLIRITTVTSSMLGLLEGQLKFMGQHYTVIGISSPDKNIPKEYLEKREQIKMYGVEMTRRITPLKDIRAIIQLYRILREHKPLIVHTHTPKAGTLGMIAAFFARVPHRLHTIAGMPLLEAHGIKRWILDIVEKITYFFATKIYPNSVGLKNIILKHNYTTINKVKVIGNGSSNGIDINHFNPELFDTDFKESFRKSLGITKEDVVFLFVGRLVGDKGINELVAAFEKISTAHKDVKLLLVGPQEKHLDPILPQTEEGITKNSSIIYVGFQKDVRPYFAISNILAFPSYREGFPNVVMQAGAMGIPTIATNINGCNEIILSGENGILIPPKNEEALHSAMKEFVVSSKVSFADAGRIRELISSRFSRSNIWKAILDEYTSLE